MNISAAATRFWPRSAMCATCRPRTDRSIPRHDFHMIWEIDPKSQQRLNDIASAVKGADKLILATDPDREGEAISWHVLEVLKQKHAIKDQHDRAGRLQRHHQAGGDRGDEASPRHRPGAGRCLSRPPGARLSRRLHPVAGAVAQAAGRALGRAGAVGGAAARLRPRARNREIRHPRILVAGGDAGDAAGGDVRGPAGRRRRPEDPAPRHRLRRRGRRVQAGAGDGRLHGRPMSRPSRRSAIPIRPSPPRPCSRRRAASSASRPPTPCGSRSGSTRASTSAARPSASSPICAPTACRSPTRRSPRSAS